MILSDYLKKTFGTKVYKISLQSGCTCPNRDGTIGRGGCSFCSAGGSGDFAAPLLPLKEQIAAAKEKVDGKFPKSIDPKDRRYIAYFQSYTNTYGDPERLGKLYEEAISFPEIAALSVATRPDCLPDPMLRMLAGLNEKKPVWVELGLQTIHERTAQRIGRGYKNDVFLDAVDRLYDAGLTVIVHIIFSLPGESREDMLQTVRFLAGLWPKVSGIKIQMLQILEGTKMAAEYKKSPCHMLTFSQYRSLTAQAVKLLPEGMVIHRLTGDPPRRLLIAPKWCTDKKRVLNTIHKELLEG